VCLASGRSAAWDGAASRWALNVRQSPESIVPSHSTASRAGVGALAAALGLGRAAVPVLLPGAARWWLPLVPALTPEDRQAIANVAVVRGLHPAMGVADALVSLSRSGRCSMRAHATARLGASQGVRGALVTVL
jgi:hypothetical protein